MQEQTAAKSTKVNGPTQFLVGLPVRLRPAVEAAAKQERRTTNTDFVRATVEEKLESMGLLTSNQTGGGA